MRVAIVTETYLPFTDGVATRLLATLAELARLRQDVLVLAPDGGPASYAGFPVVGFPGRPFFVYPDKRVIWPRPRMLGLLRRFHPDVIHTVNPAVFGAGAAIAAKVLGVPLVASYHTHFAHYARHYGYGALQRPIWAYMRMLHNQAAINLCTSAATQEELARHGFRRLRLWPPGVDTRLFRPVPPDPALRLRFTGGVPGRTVLLYVGRLASEKGIERLLPLVREDAGLNLVLVGDGPARARLQELFAGTPAVFTGYLHGEDLVAAYAAADAFIFPSTTETLGLVVLEALACGLPVLTARAAPAAALVGQAGLVYEPRDPASLADTLHRFRTEPGLRERLAAAARSQRPAAGWEGPTRTLLACYEEAIRRAPAGRVQPEPSGGG